MKLYVWDKALLVTNYGIIFALAKNVKDARKILLEECRNDLTINIEEFKKDISKKPLVCKNKSFGFYLKGGDF